MGLKIFRAGTKVTIGGSIEATVVEVLIGASDRIQYRCIWWDGRTRKNEWLEACEVTANEAELIPIGFNRNGNK